MIVLFAIINLITALNYITLKQDPKNDKNETVKVKHQIFF